MSKEIDIFKSKPELKVIKYSDDNSHFHHFKVLSPETHISGFGDSKSSSEAQTKALFEFIERSVFHLQKSGRDSTSSGWAAHTSLKLAIDSSSSELLERDAILCSWFYKISPKVLKSAKFELFHQKFPVLQFAVYNEHKIIAVILELPSKSRRMLLSTTCIDLNDGIGKLQAEAERAHRIMTQGTSLIEGAMALHDASFNSASSDELDWVYKGGKGINFPKDVKFSHTTFKVPLWDGTIAWVVQATSSDLQALYYGSSHFIHINRRRLSGLLSSPAKINRKLHPLL